MARRRPSQVRSRRRRSREFGVEGLEGRRLLAGNVAVASDAGPFSTPLVRIVDAETGAQQAAVMAFEAGFKGGVRLAMGRVTGNAAADVVAAAGSGRVAEVKVFKPVTAGTTTTLTQVLSFRPFGDSYQGGCEVAVGNVDGVGGEDIIVSKSREGGDVKVFRVTNTGGATTVALHATIAKPFGAAYNGGSSVGVADVGEFTNGALVKSVSDNRVEVLVGTGAGILAQVKVYDLSRPAAPRVADTITPAFNGAFGRPFVGGVTVTSGRYAASGLAGDIDAIVVSAGRGGSGPAQTIVYDGTVAAAASTPLRGFTAFGAGQRPNAAVFAAAVDADGNGQVDRFLVTQGDAGGPAGISNVSVAGVRSATPVTTLAGPLRIATPRTVFATQTINGTVSTPSPTAGVAAGASRPMQTREIVTGGGATANTWDKLTVQYTGMLTDGTVFDSSRQAGRTPFALTLGAGQVIPGWEAGLVGMKVGGRRLLTIPPELAYGDAARTGIPAKSTLVFDVELVSVVANRAATITGTATGSVTEDGTATTGGTLVVTDPDNAVGNVQNVFRQPGSLAGTYGAFTFNASTGVWGYTLDNTKPATQALTAGQTVTDTLVVTSIDGTASRTISVTVTGANDVASIGGTSTGGLTAGVGAMNSGGTLTATDVDAGQAKFTAPAAASLVGTYGDFTFDANTGAWSYALDKSRPATLLLRAPTVVTDSLAVTSLDGTASKTITVSIIGFTLQTTNGIVATPSPTAGIAAGESRPMEFADIVTGTGATATNGKSLTVQYKGILTNGTVFDAGTLPNPPSFPSLVLGAGSVIPGWEYGLLGMKVGGQRLLVIPPELGYGDNAIPGIPAGSTLVFWVQLNGVT